jgi:DNA-binding NarL/FixJ family response regulator
LKETGALPKKTGSTAYLSDVFFAFAGIIYFATMPTQKNTSKQAVTKDELAVIRLICQGYTTQETATKLKLSNRTVEALRNRIYQKLEVDTIARLAVEAIRRGLYSVKEGVAKGASQKQNPIFTKQERVILRLLCDGYHYAAITTKLKVSPFALDLLTEAIWKKIKKSREKEKRTPPLTTEEIAIIRFTCDGYRLSDIAQKLGVTEKSINDSRQLLYKKLYLSNAAELAVYAIARGIYKK